MKRRTSALATATAVVGLLTGCMPEGEKSGPKEIGPVLAPSTPSTSLEISTTTTVAAAPPSSEAVPTTVANQDPRFASAVAKVGSLIFDREHCLIAYRNGQPESAFILAYLFKEDSEQLGPTGEPVNRAGDIILDGPLTKLQVGGEEQITSLQLAYSFTAEEFAQKFGVSNDPASVAQPGLFSVQSPCSELTVGDLPQKG